MQAQAFRQPASGLSITDHSGSEAFKLYLIQVLGGGGGLRRALGGTKEGLGRYLEDPEGVLGRAFFSPSFVADPRLVPPLKPPGLIMAVAPIN